MTPPSQNASHQVSIATMDQHTAHNSHAHNEAFLLADEKNKANAPPATPALPPFANPGPLGLAGFATTTFALSVFNAGLLPVSAEKIVFPMAFFHGGLAQMLAGMWEFAVGNTFGATAFTSFGAFWLTFGYYAVFLAASIPEAERHHATGIFLLSWTFFNIMLLVASKKISNIFFALFVILQFTFIFLAAGNLANNTPLIRVGGWFGIVLAFGAWYLAFAGMVNTTWKKKIVPM